MSLQSYNTKDMKDTVEINFPVDDYQRNVLHIAIEKKKSNDDILALIEKYPNAVKHSDKDGFYPLQYAIIHYRYELIVPNLFDKFPQLAEEKDIDCRYLLNLALVYNGKDRVYEEFVLKLIASFPQAVKEKYHKGQYPLHYACANNISEIIVLKLVTEFPQAVKEKDRNSCYPLHLACKTNLTDKLLFKLITEFPQAVALKDFYDNYPLHYACQFARSESVVFKLISEFPQAASKQNQYYGSYPLDLTCFANHSDRVILALINLNLMAVRADRRRGGARMPISEGRGHSSSTIQQVLKELLDMSYDNLKNHVGIPKIVTFHKLKSLRRQDTFQWTLDYSPIDGKHISQQSSKKKKTKGIIYEYMKTI